MLIGSAAAGAALTLAGSAQASPTMTVGKPAAPPAPDAVGISAAVAAVEAVQPKTPIEAGLLDRARAELARLGDAIPNRDVVGVADYACASKAPRFHLVDMKTGKVDSFLVSHGRGSDKANSGYVQAFSNAVGSAASSEGAFRTADYYSGRHGRSMRLEGLDEGNSRAMERAIVVHSAWYVSETLAKLQGRVGRSEGCFAFSDADLPVILQRLGPGRLLLSTRL